MDSASSTEKNADALYQESSAAASPISVQSPESMFRPFDSNAKLSRPPHPRNSLMASPLVIGLSATGAFLCSVLLFENADSIASLFRRSHDVASAGIDVRAASLDRMILRLDAAPQIKVGEKLGPQSTDDVRDKSVPLDPNTPGALSPTTQSDSNTSSLILASNNLVNGNLSPDVPNTVPTTGLGGTGVDGLTQQLLSALPSTVQMVTAIATKEPEHIVRVVHETVIVRTMTKTLKPAANNAAQVINGVTRNGNLVQKGINTLRSNTSAPGATVIKSGIGVQTVGSGASGGSFGGFGVGGSVGGAGGGFGGASGAIGGLGGPGATLGGGLGGSLGGTVSGALGGAGNAVGAIGGRH
jgi:hypothetical protein